MEGGGEGKDQTPQVQGEGKKWTGFDPTGLERAAKPAHELDQSHKVARGGQTRLIFVCC